MAVGTGDILRLTLRQEYDSQECLNVFYYQVGSVGIGALEFVEVAEAFWVHVREEWVALVSTSVTFDRVIIENLDGGLEYAEYVIEPAWQHGALGGTPMAAYEAMSIQLNRTSRLTRHGHKRIVGLVEGQVTNFGELDPTIHAQLQDLADLFADDLMSGLAVICAPVIVGFENDNRPARVINHIDTATAKTITTTQSSRKRGHGS